MLEVAVKAADSKRAEDIVALDLEGISFIADEYLIMQAPTERQVLAIADEIVDQMEKAGFALTRQEGRREGQWVLLDYGDLIVHILRMMFVISITLKSFGVMHQKLIFLTGWKRIHSNELWHFCEPL
ncbi:ribosome-associated protein [Weissella viridescens]|uniref:Ribosome-associated protein n=1 Tax=Weissella viridescens TaxID=1629 RepID=A0A380NYS3_WEIVI|nr:ribosome-associated protein [Weissella viridescens]